MMIQSLKKIIRTFLWCIPALLLFFSLATPVFALPLTATTAIAPSIIYPTTSFTLSSTITNPNTGPVGVRVHWYKPASLGGGQINSCFSERGITAGGNISISCAGITGVGGGYKADLWTLDYSSILVTASFSVTIIAPPTASANLSLVSPASSPVPYNSSVTLGVSYQNASKCNLSYGNVGIGNVGIGNVGVGNLTSNTAFSLNCTANANTTGTPSAGLTVNVATASLTPPVAPPTNVDITADFQGIGNNGRVRVPYNGSAVLRWTSDAATCKSAEFSTGGAPNNSVGVTVSSLTTIKKFTISCTK